MTDPLDPAPTPAADAEAPPTPAAEAPPVEPPLPPPPPARVAPQAGRHVPARWATPIIAVALAIVLFVSGTALGRTGWLGGPIGSVATPVASGSDTELALIEEAWKDLHDHYVDAAHLDDRALAYAAIRGLTEAVNDPGHTAFLTADEMKQFNQSLSGTFVGIGVQVSADATGILINTVYPGTPAQTAGLHRGDRIIAVDGKATAGEAIDSVVSRVRGPEGVSVTLTIGRTGEADFDVAIVRRKLDTPILSWAMIPGRKVAFIRLEEFATGGAKALEDAITASTAAGATAIVFDLRGNGGGYVSEAVSVASQFLADGDVYQSVDSGGKTTDVAVESGGLATSIPLVVLADGGTASAAEIVSGAIQDAGRAQVVGQKTFGTGTVTGSFDLSDGSSLRIGLERWLTRAGRPIWHEGLAPDVGVALGTDVQPLVPDQVRDMSAADLVASGDAQLLRALDLLQAKG
jgi:carboxyl-terminal processing protease